MGNVPGSVILRLESNIFYPGDEVRGMVIFNLEKHKFKQGNLLLNLVGAEYTGLNDSHEKWQHYQHEFVDLTFPIAGASDGRFHDSLREFPFKFRLPIDRQLLQPSVRYDFGSREYAEVSMF